MTVEKEGTLRIAAGELEGSPAILLEFSDNKATVRVPLNQLEARAFIEGMMEAYTVIFEGREMEVLQ